MRRNSLIFIALRLKDFINKVGNYTLKEVVDIADNEDNFNNNV